MPTVTPPQGSTEQDRVALLELYAAAGGPSWSVSRPWLSNRPLAQWDGARTDGDGRVVRLDLRDDGLSGSIPESLRSLTNLRRLTLHDNKLSGSIPEWLGNLANLEALALNSNELSVAGQRFGQ